MQQQYGSVSKHSVYQSAGPCDRADEFGLLTKVPDLTASAMCDLLPVPVIAAHQTKLIDNRGKPQFWSWLGWGLSALLAGLTPSVQAAERIYVSYNLLERSIPIASLAAYAKDGTIDEDLEIYAQFAGPDAMKQLRSGLMAKAEIDPIVVAQFLYTPQGETLLQRLGQVIQTEARQPGAKAIRAALILAAADGGLTPLNVLRKFPTRGIRIDVQRSLQIAGALQTAVTQTNVATALINQQAAAVAASEPGFFNQLPDPRRPGPFAWRTRTLQLLDLDRPRFADRFGSRRIQAAPFELPGRQYPVDLYLPDLRRGVTRPAPVVVISHGLGSDRSSFIYLAQHLASHGFVVVVPEHPGSNAAQLEALINGTTSEVTQPSEFLDRPLDITFLLNDLENRSRTDRELRGRFNLQQVGVIGQSFGGYTALALAGAPINLEELRTDCPNQVNTLNLSLSLQCLARELGGVNLNLRDPRVKAVLAINPIASTVFGRAGIEQIQIPTMIVAGSADTVSPALPEQIQPFTWLGSAEKYLTLLERGTHFSVFTVGENAAITIPDEVIGPNPAIARRYINALSLAFFQTYLANQSAYRAFLSSAYAESISAPPIELSLIRSLTPEQLSQAVGGEFPLLPPAAPPPAPLSTP